MESNSPTGRSSTVASAVRKLRARAASMNMGRTRIEPTLAGNGQATDDDPARPHYPQPHLALVPEPGVDGAGVEGAGGAETAPDGKPPKRRRHIKPALALLLLMLVSLFAW